jgi:hypothetical protein
MAQKIILKTRACKHFGLFLFSFWYFFPKKSGTLCSAIVRMFFCTVVSSKFQLADRFQEIKSKVKIFVPNYLRSAIAYTFNVPNPGIFVISFVKVRINSTIKFNSKLSNLAAKLETFSFYSDGRQECC